MRKVRVLIADDHVLFAEALESMLSTDERFEVTALARDGREALNRALELRPDIVLMDIAMPALDGFEATHLLREEWPEARVLMLTGSNARADVDRARQVGAVGYVTKDRIASELIEAMLEVGSR
jgi:two-component system, NarL family, nitrate/nitrite response regulator NarL